MPIQPKTCQTHQGNDDDAQGGGTQVLGFAVVDNADPKEVAIWLVSRTATSEVKNTNSVVVDARDPESQSIIRALTADRVVLLTTDSTPVGLPMDVAALTTDDLVSLMSEADAQYERVLAAVDEYAIRPDPKTGRRPTKPHSIVRPEPPAHPREMAFQATENSAAARALRTANYLGSVWSAWLEVEQQRVRRTRTASGDLWMMPETLADPDVAELPEPFAARMEIQPC